ncbi:peptidoglycan hydrolase-like protein with peptidoglycan-binding domain [Catenulispora sp. EB89]|uniref:peptidoglycan-binding domain-containing protein n=1 Tax=Catenulispora sp. EB89 TaxID=3156257 RepID=UPI0035148A9A
MSDGATSPMPFSAPLDGGFTVSTGPMQSAISDLTGVAGDSVGAANQFQGVMLDPTSFGGIGSAVGAAHDQLFSNLGSALTSVNTGISGLNTSLSSALTGYIDADCKVGDWFDGLSMAGDSTTGTAGANGAASTTGATPTATTTDPAASGSATQASSLPGLTTLGTHHYGDSGDDVRTMQQQLNDLGYNVGTPDGQWGTRTSAALAQYAHDQGVTLPPAPGQVDPAVVHSIMNSESNNGAVAYQDGVPEIYGFRQNSHNGYDAILAARTQFGQGSAGEQAAVTQAITNEANQVNATQFADPGIQAALISSAHMRGPGGTMAMLTSMASGQQSDYAASHLDPNTVNTLQQLTPDQFQQQFHDARENYDLDYYIGGGQIAHGAHGTIPQSDWAGLQARYDREQQQYGQMSPQSSQSSQSPQQ